MNRKLRVITLAVCLGAATPLLFSGCAGDRYNRSAGQYIDDQLISGRVKDALGDHPTFKFPDVEVNTYRGVVQLSGFVASDEQRVKAEEIAKNIEGVARVENGITMKPEPTEGEARRVRDRVRDGDVDVDRNRTPAERDRDLRDQDVDVDRTPR